MKKEVPVVEYKAERETRLEAMKKEVPIGYFQQLRRRDSSHRQEEPSAVRGDGSNIQEVYDDNEGEIVRLMHLSQILPVVPDNKYIYYRAAGLLAMKHFNSRSSDIVPQLRERLGSCNLYLTMEMRNSKFNALVASSAFLSSFSSRRGEANTTTTLEAAPRPVAVVGAHFSSVSRTLATLSGSYGVPQISAGSLAKSLDSTDRYPLFGRTVPTTRGPAEACAQYLKYLGVTHVAILYTHDFFGLSFQADLVEAVARHDIKYVVVSFDRNDAEAMKQALVTIKDSQFRHICGVLQQGEETGFPEVLASAHDAGLVGDDFAWYFPIASNAPGPISKRGNFKYASALHGSTFISQTWASHPTFEASLTASMQNDTEFQSFFLESHVEGKEIYDGFNWKEEAPVFAEYTYTMYDAVMSLGLAACNLTEPFFNGTDLYNHFKLMDFYGASGRVAFDATTGTRSADTLTFRIGNVRIDDEQTTASGDMYVFASVQTGIIDFNDHDAPIQISTQFLHHDNSTQMPPPLPPREEEMNLIPAGALAFGWTLSLLLMIASISVGIILWKFRKKSSVRSSQPKFLYLMLVGVFLMASSIIFMPFQEPLPLCVLDAACMITPWLFVLGFSTAFSGLCAKLLRINKLAKLSIEMSRVKLSTLDGAMPFVVGSSINVLILLVWTLVAPLVWTRVEVANYDLFGRVVESHGICRAKSSAWIFIILLIAVNFVATLAGCYQAFQTRNMPRDFKESYYLCLCIAIILEAFLLGLPLYGLLIRASNPTASFTVRASLVTWICVAILGPMFVPKLLRKRRRRRRSSIGWSLYWSSHRNIDGEGSSFSFRDSLRNRSNRSVA